MTGHLATQLIRIYIYCLFKIRLWMNNKTEAADDVRNTIEYPNFSNSIASIKIPFRSHNNNIANMRICECEYMHEWIVAMIVITVNVDTGLCGNEYRYNMQTGSNNHHIYIWIWCHQWICSCINEYSTQQFVCADNYPIGFVLSSWLLFFS